MHHGIIPRKGCGHVHMYVVGLTTEQTPPLRQGLYCWQMSGAAGHRMSHVVARK
jgi:hypothetical protein